MNACSSDRKSKKKEKIDLDSCFSTLSGATEGKGAKIGRQRAGPGKKGHGTAISRCSGLCPTKAGKGLKVCPVLLASCHKKKRREERVNRLTRGNIPCEMKKGKGGRCSTLNCSARLRELQRLRGKKKRAEEPLTLNFPEAPERKKRKVP